MLWLRLRLNSLFGFIICRLLMAILDRARFIRRMLLVIIFAVLPLAFGLIMRVLRSLLMILLILLAIMVERIRIVAIGTRMRRLLMILSLRWVRRRCRRSLLIFLICRIMLISRLRLFLTRYLSSRRILRIGRGCGLSGVRLLIPNFWILRFVL